MPPHPDPLPASGGEGAENLVVVPWLGAGDGPRLPYCRKIHEIYR